MKWIPRQRPSLTGNHWKTALSWRCTSWEAKCCTHSFNLRILKAMTYFVAQKMLGHETPLDTSFSKACRYKLGWQSIRSSNEIFTTWKPEDAACTMWGWRFDPLPFISAYSVWCIWCAFQGAGVFQKKLSGHALGTTTSSEGTRPNGATFWSFRLPPIFQHATTAQHTRMHLKIHRIPRMQIYVTCVSRCAKSPQSEIVLNADAQVGLIESAQDALDRFEISRQYQAHLESVAADRRLETYFQDQSKIENK